MRKSLLLFMTLAGMTATVCAGVITFPATEGMDASIHYTLKADGRDVMVYDAPFASYAVFDFTGKVDVEIRADRDIKWVDVRPLSKGIKPEFKDSTIHITLTQPCNLSIELNGDYLNFPLYLFTNAPEENAPGPGDKGVIYFEGGKVHDAGLISPKSGETVYIAGGAVVKGVINAKGVENVKVMGRGILLGSENRALAREFKTRFVEFTDCKNILVKDILLVDSHTWQIVPFNTENIEVDGVRILSDNGSDDGIDIVRSRGVKIHNCFIHTKDDCIAIKSFGDYPSDVNCENIEVENCVFWNAAWGNGLEIGFELRSDYVRNIVFSNSDVIHVQAGAVFSIHNADNSIVENVVFKDIRVEDARQKLIDLAIFLSQYSVDRPQSTEEREKLYLRGAWDGVLEVPAGQEAEHSKYRGQIRNIVFKNISVEGYLPYSLINGFDESHQVQNVVIQNLTVCGHKVTTPEELKLHTEIAKGIVIK